MSVRLTGCFRNTGQRKTYAGYRGGSGAGQAIDRSANGEVLFVKISHASEGVRARSLVGVIHVERPAPRG